MESTIRQDAREVLEDLVNSHLTMDGWGRIDRLLAELGAAESSADAGALRKATTKLDLESPVRVTALGTVPVVRAPRWVRFRVNRLVHALSDGGAGSVPSTVTVRAGRIAEHGGRRVTDDRALETYGSVESPELVIHMYAPIDGPTAERAYEQLAAVWKRCGRDFGATLPVPMLGLPAGLPDRATAMSSGPAIAAATTADRQVQLIARRDHDVFNLSIAVAAADGSATWHRLDDDMRRLGLDDVDSLLGSVRLYLGTVPSRPDPQDGDGIAAGLAAALPSSPREEWYRDGTSIAGITYWDVSDIGDDDADRRVLVLATTGSGSELSAAVWSRGDAAMTPLNLYLLHAAKIHYEFRVWRQWQETERDRTDTRTRPDQVTVTISRLRDVQRTVVIARHNMAAGLGERWPLAAGNGLFAEDEDLADWLHTQLGDDIGYLEQDLVRTQLVRVAPPRPTAATPTIGLVTALPEEFTAMRAMLDDPQPWPVIGDRGMYVVGTVPSAQAGTDHPVVLTLLGNTGNDAAATSVAHLLRSFTSVDQVVMVGIAAGVPNVAEPRKHVRLGDIVVATSGMVDFDHIIDRADRSDLRQGFPRPSPLLARAAQMLEVAAKSGGRPWETALAALIEKLPGFGRPPKNTDILYADDAPGAAPTAHPPTAHQDGRSEVHNGRIGSSERSLRNAAERDRLAARHDLRAIEMEGKGVGRAAFDSQREWFVVRGISDYADAHITKLWRDHASAVAAAYVRALLAECQPIAPRPIPEPAS